MSGIQVSPEALKAARRAAEDAMEQLLTGLRGEERDYAVNRVTPIVLQAAAPILYREWSEKLLGEEAVEAVARRIALRQVKDKHGSWRRFAHDDLQAAITAAFPDLPGEEPDEPPIGVADLAAPEVAGRREIKADLQGRVEELENEIALTIETLTRGDEIPVPPDADPTKPPNPNPLQNVIDRLSSALNKDGGD